MQVQVRMGRRRVLIDQERLREIAQAPPADRAPADPPKSTYRSKFEALYAAQLENERKTGVLRAWVHEPCAFRLGPSARYRPDFLVVYADGRVEWHEVKGRWIKNRRDSITRLKWAAREYPWWTWRLVSYEKHRFSCVRVEG